MTCDHHNIIKTNNPSPIGVSERNAKVKFPNRVNVFSVACDFFPKKVILDEREKVKTVIFKP